MLTCVVARPSHSTLTGIPPHVTYAPAADYFGPDSFIFVAQDGSVSSNTATVSIMVTKGSYAPVAQSQSAMTLENAALPVTLAATQTNNDPLTYTVTTQPLNGTLSGTAPNLIYTPATNYLGPDSFTFIANDGSVSSNSAIVSITVATVVSQNQSVATVKNTALSATLVATAVNNSPLTYIVEQPAAGHMEH